MTLEQWCKLNNVRPTHPTTERQAVSLIINHDHPNRTELWHLSDYRVSSRCGVVIWLTPREEMRQSLEKELGRIQSRLAEENAQ